MKKLLEISKTLIDLEQEEREQHWLKQAQLFESQETKSLEYDPEDILNKNFKTKRSMVVQNAIKFVEETKWIFDDFEEHPLSWNNLQTSFPKRNFYRTIENLKSLDLIIETNSLYDSRTNTSKLFFLNHLIYSKFKTHFSSKYNLDSKSSNSKTLSYHISDTCGKDEDEDVENLEAIDFDKSKMKVCKRMRMDVTNIPNSALIAALEENYPQVKHYAGIVEKLNEDRPEEQKIKWNFNLKIKNKDGRRFLTKIGFRASSLICSYKEHVNNNPFYQGKWRKDYLESVYGKDYSHYDVNASIYRLTYNLNHENPLDFDKDVYEIMYGSKFESKEDREAYKKICMRLMFGDFKTMGNCVERRICQLSDESYNKSRKNEIQKTMEESKIKMYEFLESSYDSEIFLHESCIYVDMLSKISKDSCLVYDSFYSKSNLDFKYMNKLYLDSLDFYKSNFSLKTRISHQKLVDYHISDTCGNSKVQNQNDDIDFEFEKREEAKRRKICHVHDKLLKYFDNAEFPKSVLNMFEEHYNLKLTTRKSWYVGNDKINTIFRKMVYDLIEKIDKGN